MKLEDLKMDNDLRPKPIKVGGKTIYVHPCYFCKMRGYFESSLGKRRCIECKGNKYVVGRKGVPYAR
jgi:hypothetical protein